MGHANLEREEGYARLSGTRPWWARPAEKAAEFLIVQQHVKIRRDIHLPSCYCEYLGRNPLPTGSKVSLAMPDFFQSLWNDRVRLIQGAAVGAALTVTLGFNWIGYGFNWSTGGNAQKMALVASTDAMIPICADQFLALGPEAQAEYARTKVNDRDDVIRKHLKKVGAVSVDYSFARACASAIDTRGQMAGKGT
jgi:hypothetical protein